MEVIEQGQLKISGIPCEGPPFRLQIRQGFNSHGCMKAGIWVPEEIRGEIRPDMQVILEPEAGTPVFCGVVKRAAAGKEKGQDCEIGRASCRDRVSSPV